MKLANQLIILFFLFFIILIEINFFLYNLSGIDQIRHLSWIFFLSNSDHFLPIDFLKNYKTIYSDSFGFIYELFRYSHKDVGHTLNIIPILITYLFSFIFGLKPYLLNLVSIIFSSLSIFLSYKISLLLLNDDEIKKNKFLSLIFLLIFSSSYIFYFSSLGIHNIALFFFLLTIYFFLKINDFNTYKNNFYLCFFIALACYSHKINALILPLPIAIYLFLSNKKKYQGLQNISLVILNFLIFFSPIIFLIFFSESTINDNIMYAEINFDYKELIVNFKTWFYTHAKNIGFINFIIFLLSSLFFLFKEKSNITNKLLIIIFFHLMFSIFINGFMNYHIRTTLYSTFVILIINFIFLIKILRFNKKIFFILLGIVFINFSQQVYIVFNKDYFIKYRADIYNFYFKNIENIKFSSVEKEIEKINNIIPKNGNIIFYTNLSEDLYFVYSKRNLKNLKYKNLKPIKNLIYYQNKNILNEYLDKINFKKIKIVNTYLIAISGNNEDIHEKFNKLNKSEIFLNQCIMQNNSLYKNNIFISGIKKLSLFKINC